MIPLNLIFSFSHSPRLPEQALDVGTTNPLTMCAFWPTAATDANQTGPDTNDRWPTIEQLSNGLEAGRCQTNAVAPWCGGALGLAAWSLAWPGLQHANTTQHGGMAPQPSTLLPTLVELAGAQVAEPPNPPATLSGCGLAPARDGARCVCAKSCEVPTRSLRGRPIS